MRRNAQDQRAMRVALGPLGIPIVRKEVAGPPSVRDDVGLGHRAAQRLAHCAACLLFKNMSLSPLCPAVSHPSVSPRTNATVGGPLRLSSRSSFFPSPLRGGPLPPGTRAARPYPGCPYRGKAGAECVSTSPTHLGSPDTRRAARRKKTAPHILASAGQFAVYGSFHIPPIPSRIRRDNI